MYYVLCISIVYCTVVVFDIDVVVWQLRLYGWRRVASRLVYVIVYIYDSAVVIVVVLLSWCNKEENRI